MENLSALLMKLRGDLSIREASKRIGISHTYLDTLEKGFDKRSGNFTKPTPETLKLISNAYNYPYEDLMFVAGYISDYSLTSKDQLLLDKLSNHIELVDTLLNMSDEKLQALRKLLDN